MKKYAINATMATGLIILKSATGEFTPQQCSTFGEFDLDLRQFDRHPEYFRGDGEVNIEEYIRFSTGSCP